MQSKEESELGKNPTLKRGCRSEIGRKKGITIHKFHLTLNTHPEDINPMAIPHPESPRKPSLLSRIYSPLDRNPFQVRVRLWIPWELLRRENVGFGHDSFEGWERPVKMKEGQR